MEKQGIRDKVIYSDSYNAILWVKKKQCKTKLERTAATEPLYQIIARAEAWLRTHTPTVPVIKWETKLWGEVPRSEEHTSELQSRQYLVCRLLLEKKNN